MSDVNHSSTVFTALAQYFGIPAQDLIERPALSVNEVTLTLSLSERFSVPHLQAACVITKLPSDYPSDQLHLMLRMNLLAEPTKGATIGLKRDWQLVLAQRFPLDIPLPVLAQHLRTLADTAKQWEAAIFNSVWN